MHTAHNILKITACLCITRASSPTHRNKKSRRRNGDFAKLENRSSRKLRRTARGDQASKRRDKGSGDKSHPCAPTNIAASSWQGQEPHAKSGEKGKNGRRGAKGQGGGGKWSNHVMGSGSKFDDMVARGQMHSRNLTSRGFLFQNHGKTLR